MPPEIIEAILKFIWLELFYIFITVSCEVWVEFYSERRLSSVCGLRKELVWGWEMGGAASGCSGCGSSHSSSTCSPPRRITSSPCSRYERRAVEGGVRGQGGV